MGKVSSSNSQGVHVPKLRFPEFNETWELSRLSDISYYQTGKDIVPKSKYVSTENMLQNFAGMEPYKDEAIVSGIPFASGDVLIANIRPYLKKIWKANFAGCCNTDVLVLHSANINPDYLYYNIAREDFITHVMSGVKGSKMPRGDKTQILEYKVGVPTHKEQQKIASILSLLDNRIVKQRQLIEALKSYKRGALSKLFPKKGETMPEYRFAGFTEPWEQRKLIDEVSSVDTGKSKFSLSNVGAYEILGSTSVIGYDSSYDYEGDFILTARVGANAGKLYRHSGKVKISDNTVFIQGKQLDFIYYALLNFDIKKLSFGTGQPLVKASELKDQTIRMPISEMERESVGNFFLHLDHLITLHQRMLSEFRDIKAGLLQQLFI